MQRNYRFLVIACVLLFFSSFSYIDRSDDEQKSALVTRTQVVTRVAPMAAVVLLSAFCIPIHDYGRWLRRLTQPPFVFWTWYTVVACVAGFIYGLQPIWSAWKCTEIMVTVIWAASVATIVFRTQSGILLDKCMKALCVSSHFVVWYALGTLYFSEIPLHDYLFEGARLHTEWPHINSISLSVIAVFAMLSTFVILGARNLNWSVLLGVPAFAVFVFARSRTGLLVFAALALYATFGAAIGRAQKALLVAVLVMMACIIMASPRFREQLRVDSVHDLKRGAGRILDEEGRRSAWSESLEMIQKSPAIGYGYINARRFIDDRDTSVDNGVLQGLIAAGIIGAARPAIGYVALLGVYWGIGSSVSGFWNRREHRLAGLGLIAYCVAISKAATTNSLSAYDLPLILMLLSAITLSWVHYAGKQHVLSQLRSRLEVAESNGAEDLEMVVADPLQ